MDDRDDMGYRDEPEPGTEPIQPTEQAPVPGPWQPDVPISQDDPWHRTSPEPPASSAFEPKPPKRPINAVEIAILVLLCVIAALLVVWLALSFAAPKSEPESEPARQTTQSTEPKVDLNLDDGSGPTAKPTTPSVDTSELESAIDKAKGLDQSKYTDASWKTLQDALSNAESALASEYTGQSDVNIAVQQLRKAMDALVEKPVEVPFNPGDYEWPAYEDVARNPDDFKGRKVAFSGKVVQVMDGANEVDIRLAVDDDYDQMVFCAYEPSIIDYRVLEDDYITVYGDCVGLYTYTSTLGASISIPGVLVTHIDLSE